MIFSFLLFIKWKKKVLKSITISIDILGTNNEKNNKIYHFIWAIQANQTRKTEIWNDQLQAHFTCLHHIFVYWTWLFILICVLFGWGVGRWEKHTVTKQKFSNHVTWFKSFFVWSCQHHFRNAWFYSVMHRWLAVIKLLYLVSCN